MIEAVSSAGPKPTVRAMDKVSQEQLHAPGSYSREVEEILHSADLPQSPPSRQDNGGGFLGFLGKLVLGVIVAGVGVVAARRYIPALSSVDISKELPSGAKGMEKFKYDFSKFADGIERNTIGYFKKMKDDRAAEKAKSEKI